MNTTYKRLFLAIWPPVEKIRAIYDWVKVLIQKEGGKQVKFSQLHLTLQFLGNIEESKISDLCFQLRLFSKNLHAFNVNMQSIKVWKKNGLFVLVGSQEMKHQIISQNLHQLVNISTLSRKLSQKDKSNNEVSFCLLDRNFKESGNIITGSNTHIINKQTHSNDFIPHITLARKFHPKNRLPLEYPTLSWKAKEILLVHSILTPSGPVYKTLDRFSLKKKI